METPVWPMPRFRTWYVPRFSVTVDGRLTTAHQQAIETILTHYNDIFVDESEL